MTGENDTPKTYPIGSAEGRAQAERRIAEAKRTGATELDLGGLGLDDVPSSLLALGQLEKLSLGLAQDARQKPYYEGTEEDKKACNAVSALPPALFSSLLHLQSLHLEHNQLSSLPAEIGKLAGLQTLDLQGNQLSSLPPEIGKLTALQWLNLSGNQLSSLPAEIGRLAGLQWHRAKS